MPFLERSLAEAASTGRSVRTPNAQTLTDLLPLVRERLPRLDAIGPLVDYVFLDQVELEPSVLVPRRWDVSTTVDGLQAARVAIAALGPVSFEAEQLEATLRGVCDGYGWKPGDLFMAIRVALTGRTATPPLFDTMVSLGYERTLMRLDRARLVLDGVRT
jgi:glutamyl-tRNA synthetase